MNDNTEQVEVESIDFFCLKQPESICLSQMLGLIRQQACIRTVVKCYHFSLQREANSDACNCQ